jgi:hypothetical protein
MSARHFEWRGRHGWTQSTEDAEYYRQHPL